MLDVVARRLAEGRGDDKVSLGTPRPTRASKEVVHIWTADSVAGCVALGLDIDQVKAEATLFTTPERPS
jgi:hypothetical protein